MYWANFLHIYQPPTQTEAIVRKVTAESYRTIIRVLESAPKAKITLNINGSLTEQLARYDLTDVIQGLRRLAENGQIEFTGSAIYHPILPLIPRNEIIRQVNLNTELNRRYFGDVYQPKGFFPPEMCYSYDVARVISELGFSWLIVDEIAFNGKLRSYQTDTIYTLKGLPRMTVFFKERPFSAGITYGTFPSSAPFLKAIGTGLTEKRYLLTGTDGEVYGHHRPGQEKLLEEVFASNSLKTCSVSDLVQLFPRRQEIAPLASSWSTWEDEITAGIPYPQWNYPGNEIHHLQWQLTNSIIGLVGSLPQETPGFEKARHLLDEGLHSCQFWWASCRPWWDTGMIASGAEKLRSIIDVMGNNISEDKVSDIDRLFRAIVTTARQWQDTGKANQLKEQYLKDHGEVTSELSFGAHGS